MALRAERIGLNLSGPVAPLLRAMAPRRTRERLQHDRKTLRKALKDYQAGPMDHLDELEQARVIDSITRRIADLDAKIEALGGA